MTSTRPPDLDNKDIWQFERVRRRYARYCARYHIDHVDLEVSAYDIERGWTAGIIDCLLERAKLGDLAAAQICIEMMEEDRGLAYGSIVKSNIPRALAKCELTIAHQERICKRVVEMLLRPFLPKEFRQYAWLARRIGLGKFEKKLHKADREDPWVNWYVLYLTLPNPPRPPYSWETKRYKHPP